MGPLIPIAALAALAFAFGRKKKEPEGASLLPGGGTAPPPGAFFPKGLVPQNPGELEAFYEENDWDLGPLPGSDEDYDLPGGGQTAINVDPADDFPIAPEEKPTRKSGRTKKKPAGRLTKGIAVIPSAETAEEIADAKAAQTAAQDRAWQEAVADAVGSGDAQTVDAVADEMKADGMGPQAKTVKKVAKDWRKKAAAETNALLTEAGEEPTVTDLDVEQAEEPAPEPPPNPMRENAVQFAQYLRTQEPWFWGKEDASIVESYQEGLGKTPDGRYGPGDAAEIAFYGVIPPAPFYWPSSGTNAAIANYRATLTEKAAQDPARAEQWIAAATTAVR